MYIWRVLIKKFISVKKLTILLLIREDCHHYYSILKMENSALSQDNGPREVFHALSFEFKVAVNYPLKVQKLYNSLIYVQLGTDLGIGLL